MKAVSKLLIAGALCISSALCSAESADDAKGLLDDALSNLKSKGMQAASADFVSGGKWLKGSLYVVVVGFDGVIIAHSANDKLVGKNMLDAKDAAGRTFIREAIAAAKSTGSADIPLRWGNPTTKQIADAVICTRRVPGHDAYAGVVYFK